MRPIFIAPYTMRFKKFDKLLFLILIVLVCSAYGLYYLSSRQNSIRSSQTLKSIFYSAKLSDTIKRIESIYKDECSTGFWIASYQVDYVVVNLCKYPQLRSVEIGDVIQKERNSTECTITGKQGKRTKVNLQIEY